MTERERLRQEVYDAAFYSGKPEDPFPQLLDAYMAACVMDIEKRVKALEDTLITLIGWISESANSPISTGAAARLISDVIGDGND